MYKYLSYLLVIIIFPMFGCQTLNDRQEIIFTTYDNGRLEQLRQAFVGQDFYSVNYDFSRKSESIYSIKAIDFILEKEDKAYYVFNIDYLQRTLTWKFELNLANNKIDYGNYRIINENYEFGNSDGRFIIVELNAQKRLREEIVENERRAEEKKNRLPFSYGAQHYFDFSNIYVQEAILKNDIPRNDVILINPRSVTVLRGGMPSVPGGIPGDMVIDNTTWDERSAIIRGRNNQFILETETIIIDRGDFIRVVLHYVIVDKHNIFQKVQSLTLPNANGPDKTIEIYRLTKKTVVKCIGDTNITLPNGRMRACLLFETVPFSSIDPNRL